MPPRKKPAEAVVEVEPAEATTFDPMAKINAIIDAHLEVRNPDVFISDSYILILGDDQTLEYFDGDHWFELTEARPDIKLRGNVSVAFPEHYVRVPDTEFIMLWPKPRQEFVFRRTTLE